MDDFLLILKNNLAVFLGILQVKKSCKKGSVLHAVVGGFDRRVVLEMYAGCVNGERSRVYSINFTGEGFQIGCYSTLDTYVGAVFMPTNIYYACWQQQWPLCMRERLKMANACTRSHAHQVT